MPIASTRGEVKELADATRALYIPCFTVPPELVSEITGHDALCLAKELHKNRRPAQSERRKELLVQYGPLLTLIFNGARSWVTIGASRDFPAGAHSDAAHLGGMAAHVQAQIRQSASTRHVRMCSLDVEKVGENQRFASFEEMDAEHTFEGKIEEGSVTPFASGALKREDGKSMRSHHEYQGAGDFVRINEAA